jgi:hypothetical protein
MVGVTARRMNAEQMYGLRNVSQGGLEENVDGNSRRVAQNACRYLDDDTGECLLDMLIRVSQLTESWRCGVPCLTLQTSRPLT